MHPIVIHALVKSRMEQNREAERRRLARAEMPREGVLSRAGRSALSITGVALGWRRPRRGVALNHGKAAVWVISPRGLPAESWADSPLPEVVTDLAPCEWTPGTAPGGTKSRRGRPMHIHPPQRAARPRAAAGDAGAGQPAASGARGASRVPRDPAGRACPAAEGSAVLAYASGGQPIMRPGQRRHRHLEHCIPRFAPLRQHLCPRVMPFS
jgi:hypothetical protein